MQKALKNDDIHIIVFFKTLQANKELVKKCITPLNTLIHVSDIILYTKSKFSDDDDGTLTASQEETNVKPWS